MLEMREWHIVISGFQQRRGKLNGMVTIWRDLIDIVQSKPSARVELLLWSDSVSEMAEQIKLLSPELEMPIVNIYGYSWGGQSAVNLAKELRRRSIKVNRLTLSDPVYRASRFLMFFWLLQWRAFWDSYTITVPDNVLRATAFYQRSNYPRGHLLKAANPGLTEIDEPVIVNTDHCWMDQNDDFRTACRNAAWSIKRTEAV